MTRIPTLFGLCVTMIVTSAVPALGQAPTITSPTPNQVFRAGPDYASDVLHDPWDFNNPEDIAQHPHMYLGWNESTSALSNGPSAFLTTPGWFTGTSNHTNPGLGLLYSGGALAASPGRSGQKYPIDSTRYQVLSFKIRLTGTPSAVVLRWFTHAFGAPGGGQAIVNGVVQGDAVYALDLGAPWSSEPVTGVRLDPTSSVGTTVQMDWVRLTTVDATMPVTVEGCGGGSHDVAIVEEGTGGVARSVGTISGSSASTTVNYGIFPPGAYRLRVACSAGPIEDRPFIINGPPLVTVLDPDERGGADYAATVLGNPWDMEDGADVPEAGNLESLSQPNAPGGGHMLRASNSSNPALSGDPQVFLLSGPNNFTPIASRRYRYLTYTLKIDAPFGTDPSRDEGSLVRIHWGSGPSLFSGGATTQDILVWPGRNTYTIDLGAMTKANLGLDENCPAPCPEWTARSPRFLRIDPHEFGRAGVFFDLDNVTLAASDEVALGGAFPVRWNIADGDPRGYNLEMFYDADPSFANGGWTLIGSGPVSAGPGQFAWTPPAPGNYYIHLRVTEVGTHAPQVAVRTSTGFLHVPSPIAPGVLSIATHASGGGAHAPFNIGGCAYNSAGGAHDEVFVYAHPRQGQMGGAFQYLGYNAAGGLGTIGPGPCAGGPPGYQVSNVFGLSPGLWAFRVLARNTQTGDIEHVLADNVNVALTAAAARNLRASVSGNTVTLAWDPPGQGSLSQYRIEAAPNPNFAPYSHAVFSASQTSVTATLGNGTYYMRIRTGNTYTTEGPTSNVINFTLPGGGAVAPPGAVTLAGQLNANPVSLNWSQAGGGAATYALHAGSAPGASNVAVVPMGAATGLPPVVVPTGVTIYARIVASNAAGSTVSNEVVVQVPAAGPPGGPPIQLDPVVSGNTVMIRWNPPAGGATPTSYTIVGRLPGSPAVLATAPGLTSTSLTVSGVPRGSYLLTIVAMYGGTPSIESNAKTLVVP